MPDAAPATPAFAERVLSQQGGAGLHARGHVAVHGGLEFDGEKHVGPGRAFGDGPAGDAPGHVGAATAEPTTFLGYVLLPNGRLRLPGDNVRRFRNRLRSMKDRLRAGSLTPEEAQPRIASWVAHAKHANTRRLRRALFRGGPFGSPPVAVDGT